MRMTKMNKLWYELETSPIHSFQAVSIERRAPKVKLCVKKLITGKRVRIIEITSLFCLLAGGRGLHREAS